jgi:hypothetical protein
MKQKDLFEMENEIVVKKFGSKDVFFNNGIVNLYQFLKERDFEFEYELNQNELILKIDSQKQDEIYNQIFKAFLKDNKIVVQTDNDRWYFDDNLNIFRLGKRYQIIGASSGNDIKNSYLYKTPDELNLSIKSIQDKYMLFCFEYQIMPDTKEKMKNGIKVIDYIKEILSIPKKMSETDKLKIINYINDHRDLLNVPNGDNQLIIYSTQNEIIDKSIHSYFVKDNILKLDSKIHSFEDGQDCFHDMLKPSRSYKIDKWNALIYWFGGRMKRFYNFSYFIYPNSSNLQALNRFKDFLQIGDDKIEYRDEKGKVIPTSSNIDFFQVLSKDEIMNKHFYISKSAEEFELKFFMYLFSMMYHIEERYEKANERRRERQKELFDTLQYMSFVIYTEDGTFKASLNEYTRAYQLIQFFQVLKEDGLFTYFGSIFQVFSLSQGKDEINLNLRHWCQKLLSFSNLRKEYYLTSFNILKKDSKSFGKLLFELEQSYLKHILGGKDMSIHEDSKKVGDGIGYFCAVTKDKNLLFKLRNVKNYKQLVSYFKDLKFSALKNEKEARFSKEFNDSLESILESIEQNWEIARDYIAIYAIDKFKATSYQNSKSNQGE